MWYGQFFHTLDNKERIILPAKLRDKIKNLKKKKFFLTRGLDNCLFLFDQVRWEQVEQKLNEIPFTKKESRAFNRLLFSGAQEIDLDTQGRITLPGYLKEVAKIERDVVIVGVGDRIEIWAKNVWAMFCDGSQDKFEEIAENLFE